MNYEQRYKEALERARKLATDLPNGRNDRLYHVWDLENIFPELKESEDERIIRCIKVALTDVDEKRFNDYDTTLKDCLAWLEKQGEYPSWSEEDEQRLQDVIYWFEIFCDKNKTKPEMKESLAWLKSIKDRVQPQPKQEWSKKDEDIKETIIGELELVKKSVGEINYKGYDELINWLKSLKPRWKPSGEQMEALNAINNVGELSYVGQANLLIKLYNELKNL